MPPPGADDRQAPGDQSRVESSGGGQSCHGRDVRRVQRSYPQLQPGIQRLKALLDEAAALRGRRARIEHLVNGFVDFLIRNRHYAVMASTDPAAKRDHLDSESMTMRQRALTLLFGDNPTGTERLCFNAMFFIPECLPDLADLTDDELREALQTTMLRMLRVPSGSRE